MTSGMSVCKNVGACERAWYWVPCDVWTRSMLSEIEGGWAVGRCGLREAFGNMIGLSDPI